MIQPRRTSAAPINVYINQASETARENRAKILNLVTALEGGKELYIPELHATMDAVCATDDRAKLAQLAYDLVDASVVVALAAASLASIEADVDLPDLLHALENAIDEIVANMTPSP